MEGFDGDMFARVLNERSAEFERYMTSNRWDSCSEEGLYADEALYAVSCFVEFCEKGFVTGPDGEELEE